MGDNRGLLGFVIGLGIATLFWVLLFMSLSLVATEALNEAHFSVANLVGENLNITVFVLNGEDWDEIAVSISNNTTIPLVITWYGEGRVNVHIVYDDWDNNERVLRYRVENGEYRVVVLI